MPSPSWRRTFGLTAILGLCACGGSDSNVYLLDFGYHSNTLVMGTSSVEMAPDAFRSADHLFFKVESLTYRLADLRMDLPPELRCKDAEEVLSPTVSCEDAVAGIPDSPYLPGSEEGPRGALHLPGPVEVGTNKTLTVRGEQVFIPRVAYDAIDTRWDPGTPEHPSFQLRARFMYLGKPRMLEFAFQSDEPMRFEIQGIPMGLPREFADHPAAFGGTLDMDDWLKGTDIGGCLATGDLTLDGNVLRLETGRGACADAATYLRLSIQQSGNLFAGLRR
ncbi:hypothetical protein JYK02_32005 [Corallococcus macrosporus]|uniref:Lipoprotein n=1 Tax=Corallococcus macrosporus TaxID=35 RepID=A0ABS3DLE1_9BACT|nr:hypothetical protein [Corallococcus macrosporus]MBN8232150.1 hypothetical protein [Corallococcus macrosporus]